MSAPFVSGAPGPVLIKQLRQVIAVMVVGMVALVFLLLWLFRDYDGDMDVPAEPVQEEIVRLDDRSVPGD